MEELKERLEALQKEVTRLEKQNRRLVWGLLTALTFAVLPYLLASQWATPPVVRANRFEIVSEKTGEVIATIRGLEDRQGGGLGFFGKGGKQIAELFVLPNGGALTVLNQKGESVVTLAPNDSNGGALFVSNQGEKLGVGLIAHSDGTGLTIYNQEEKAVLDLGAYPSWGGLTIFNKEEKVVAQLTADADGGLFRIHSRINRDTAAVALGVTKDGSGIVITANALGRVLWTSPMR